MTHPQKPIEAEPKERPRHWFIQKPTAHNCPLEIKGAVFEEFMPTIVQQNCEWIKVFSADDIQARIGMGLTRYMFIMDENHALRKALEIHESETKMLAECLDSFCMEVGLEIDENNIHVKQLCEEAGILLEAYVAKRSQEIK